MITIRDHQTGDLFDPWDHLGEKRRQLLEGLRRTRSARLLNTRQGEDRCFLLRCYRKPQWFSELYDSLTTKVGQMGM